jgi:penicillin-binding protein 2B
MFPKDNPQVIIYAAAQRTNANALYTSVKKVVKNTANYMNINNKEVIEEKDINYVQENFINRKTEDVVKNLTEKKIKYVLIGDGDKIINQYPKKDNIVNTNEHVFLLTSGTNYKMPNIKNYSLKEVLALTTLLDIDVTVDGTGYVKSYNIKEGTLITKDTTLEVKLETLYSEA